MIFNYQIKNRSINHKWNNNCKIISWNILPKFRQINILLDIFYPKLIWRKNCVAVNFLLFYTFWKISVKTTYLVKSLTIKLISRKNSQVIQKFHKLHTVWSLRVSWFFEKFPWKQLFSKAFYCKIDFTK